MMITRVDHLGERRETSRRTFVPCSFGSSSHGPLVVPTETDIALGHARLLWATVAFGGKDEPVDVLTTPPSRRPWVSADGAIVYCAALLGAVVAALLKVKLGQWNDASVRACVSTGTAADYCRNTEQYPIVLQWAYALIAGWATFFTAWVVFTVQPRLWQLI